MHLVVRADATPEIGVGHLMRTFALTEEWLARGGRVTLAGAAPRPLVERFAAGGAEYLRIPFAAAPRPEELLDVLGPPAGSWCVVDGYRFTAGYTAALRRAGWRVAVIDDLADGPAYDADVLMNQNLGAERLRYPTGPDTVRLLGARYAMLRREFTGRAWPVREHPAVADRLLVTMGGGDPDQVAARVASALADPRLSRVHARIVVGPANPEGRAAIHAAIGSALGRVETVTSAVMPELMAWANMAVSAAGSTVWEAAFAGLPMLLVVTADNQVGVAREVQAAGAALSLGPSAGVTSASLADAIVSLAFDRAARQSLSRLAAGVVDGGGAARLADALIAHRLTAAGVTLTELTLDDAEPLWQLANDPTVRAAAFSQAAIPWASHLEWLRARLSPEGRRRTRIFGARTVGPAGGALVAQIRYDDVGDGAAEIDFAVAGSRRGLGLGTGLLAATVEAACEALAVETARGLVLDGNVGSAMAFRRAGFHLAGRGARDGRAFEVFERRVSGRKHV